MAPAGAQELATAHSCRFAVSVAVADAIRQKYQGNEIHLCSMLSESRGKAISATA